MILVDTSVWIDHLHAREPTLVHLLEQSDVCSHPMVVAELALGTMKRRDTVLELLNNLPTVNTATGGEVLHLIESHGVHGEGLSVVDAHLLAAARITAGVRLWTRDKRLHSTAKGLDVGAADLV